MRIDLYTRTVLTLIALFLAAIAARPYFEPDTVAAQSALSGVQVAVTPVGYTFFDTRTGDLWEYSGANVHAKYRLAKPGQPLTPEKP
jgi:hypothetical protein